MTGVDPGYFERRCDVVFRRNTLLPSLRRTAEGEGQTSQSEHIWFHSASIAGNFI
jgi:hypothetical protein